MNNMIDTNFHFKSAQTQSMLKNTQPKPDKMREAAEGFASVFLSQMVDKMFNSVDTEGFFGKNMGQDIFKSLMTQEYSKAIAKDSPLSDQIQQTLLQYQEV